MTVRIRTSSSISPRSQLLVTQSQDSPQNHFWESMACTCIVGFGVGFMVGLGVLSIVGTDVVGVAVGCIEGDTLGNNEGDDDGDLVGKYVGQRSRQVVLA